jgi:chemotaxis response regulator CheB/chemotaxis methyl-accepting protein methylase
MESEDKLAVDEVCKIVSEMSGIQLGEKQYSMVENRLKSRLLRLSLSTFSEYLRHLKMNKEFESQALLSLMTTHHTFFFREFGHFEYLLNHVLPQAIEVARYRDDKTIHLWSAACSRGQEVYSLAMFMVFHLKQMAPDLRFHIWGTDVDPESVERAKQGVYKAEEIKQSPAMYVDGHWVKGQASAFGFVKAKDHLKTYCSFATVNLQSPESFLKNKKFDIIFCRNVFIYFNSEQIKDITKNLMNHLIETGYLFLGVSETLQGLGLDVNLKGASVYQHKKAPPTKPISVAVPTPSLPKVMNVLCIDDSKTILALMKKILTPENGFRIVATAENGVKGLEEMKKHSIDVITLDLHMPELDGVGFLKKKNNAGPAVLVVSSINRDDVTIAQMAIQNGAADYVEKPSLENMAQAGNEIRSKLKTIWQMKNKAIASTTKVEDSRLTATSIKTPDKKKVKVLIVDDSSTMRQLLEKIINSDPTLQVVASAAKPSEVDGLIRKHRPDVLTFDINMPEMNGVELVKKIHPVYKIPIIMISSLSPEDGPLVMQALENGAIDYIQKPNQSEMSKTSLLIRERIKMAAAAKVLNFNFSKRKVSRNAASVKDKLIVMGSSTGGTEALRVILESLPNEIPPILIVQHIPAFFSAAFASRLNTLVNFEVLEAKDGDEVKPNRVLIAPGGKQMGIKIVGEKKIVYINDDSQVNRHKPSVDYLFESVSRLKIDGLISVILTGMGADGARQMKSLRDQGARTIAQDEATSVVFGMPREAIQLGAAEFVLPIHGIAEKIVDLLNESKKIKIDLKTKRAG